MTLATIGAISGLIAFILTMIGFGAIAIARYRTTKDDETLNIWKGNAEAQKARADIIEKEFAEYRSATVAQIASLTSRLEALETENRVLKSLDDIRDSVRTDIAAAFSKLPCQLIKDA